MLRLKKDIARNSHGINQSGKINRNKLFSRLRALPLKIGEFNDFFLRTPFQEPIKIQYLLIWQDIFRDVIVNSIEKCAQPFIGCLNFRATFSRHMPTYFFRN